VLDPVPLTVLNKAIKLPTWLVIEGLKLGSITKGELFGGLLSFKTCV
jgi:hypothetical protein